MRTIQDIDNLARRNLKKGFCKKVNMDTGNVMIGFNKNEAIVLFEFLSRFLEGEHSEVFEHKAEIKVLNDVLAVLESRLSQPFSPDYSELLANARNAITLP